MLPKRAKLFEFSVAVAVIGVCSFFLLSALQRIEEEAERVIVEATIQNVNTGARYAQAQLIVQGRESEVFALYAGSPVRWLERPPPQYVELERAGESDFVPGRWVWERQSGVFSYKPRQRTGLKIAGAEVLQWRWSAGGVMSLRAGLQPVRQYLWRVE